MLSLVRSGKKVRAIHRRNSDFAGVKSVFFADGETKEASALFNEVNWVEADITNIPSLEEAFSGISVVYHCAALISFDPAKNKLMRKINIEGTANIVNLCIKNKIDKLCFVSSIATFDLKLNEEQISESSSWNGEKDHTVYAITKYGAEMEVWRASQEGVSVTIVNPGLIIGPGFWDSGTGTMFKMIERGWKYHFPKISGFVGVEDVVSIMRKLTEGNYSGEQVIAVSENKSFRDVLQQIARALNKPTPSIALKSWMAYMAATALKIFPFLHSGERKLTLHTARELYLETFYNNNKVKDLIGFEFEDINSVIQRTAMQLKKEKEELNSH